MMTKQELDDLRELHRVVTKENPGCNLVYCREHAAYHTSKPCPEMLLGAIPRLIDSMEALRSRLVELVHDVEEQVFFENCDNGLRRVLNCAMDFVEQGEDAAPPVAPDDDASDKLERGEA